jgi:hypothetical protein
MKDFSIIIPSRGRPDWTARLLNNIRTTAKDLSRIEAVIIVDEDDAALPYYRDFQFVDLFISLVIQPRTPRLAEDYINKQARESEAKYIWPLNDDCLIATKHWDEIIREKAKESKSGIFYGRARGSNHMINYTGQDPSSGFPLLSKKAVDTLGFFFFPHIESYGSEGALYWIFANMPGAVLELGVEVDHHGGRNIKDETQRDLRKNEFNRPNSQGHIKRARAIIEAAMRGESK